MHRGHDHHHGNGYAHGEGPAFGAGHNHAGRPAKQWQTPHAPEQPVHEAEPEPDFDLVEQAFAEAFPRAPDATSFLRLAQIPFAAYASDGKLLNLLRVEFSEATDVGAVAPHLGGDSFHYDPLPAKMVSRRRKLAFVYHDGTIPRALSLAETRMLVPSARPEAGLAPGPTPPPP